MQNLNTPEEKGLVNLNKNLAVIYDRDDNHCKFKTYVL